jgi:amino acid transporter
MSESSIADGPVSANPSVAAEPARLQGSMGTLKLILTVLAVAAPLGAVAGVVPIVIGNGNGVGAPGTYAVVGIILLLFAVGFTTMSRHMPRTGGFYAYVAAGLGRPLGLGASFIALFGYLTLMLGAYGLLGVSIDSLLVDLFGLPSVSWIVYALLSWVVVTILGHLNVEVSGNVLAVLMVLEVLTVFALNLPVLFRGGPEGWQVESFTPEAFSSGSIGLGILFATATFLGFEATAIYRSEVKDPERTVPRATYLSVVLIALFYVLSSWALITAFGPSNAVEVAQTDPAGMFATALQNYVGTAMRDVMTVLLVTSVFASVLSAHNPLARYFFNLGKDGVFPRALGRVHRRHGSPSLASLATSIIALLFALPFVLSGLDVVTFYSWMFGIGAFALLILMALTCVSVVAFFRRYPADEPQWNTMIAPVLGFIGLVVMIVIISANFTLLIGGDVVLAVVFQAITFGLGLLGVVLALIWARTRPQVYQRIGGHHDA